MPLRRYYRARRRRRRRKTFAQRVREVVFPTKHFETTGLSYYIYNVSRGNRIVDQSNESLPNSPGCDINGGVLAQYPQVNQGVTSTTRIGNEIFCKGLLFEGYLSQPSGAFSDNVGINPLHEWLQVMVVLRRSRASTVDRNENRVRFPDEFLQNRNVLYPSQYNMRDKLDRNMLYDTKILYKRSYKLTRVLPTATTDEAKYGSGGKQIRIFIPHNMVVHYHDGGNDPLSNFFAVFMWVENSQSNPEPKNSTSNWLFSFTKRLYFRDSGA